MKNIYLGFLIPVLITIALPGCGWIRSLRRDLEDDEINAETSLSDFDYYKDPANRFVPPPPATVQDARAATLSGSPVDLSGTRAKKLRTTAADFFNEAKQNENSLWAEEGQNNYFFARNKLKMPGDLVTVVIEDQLRGDMVNSVRKTLPSDYQDKDIIVPGLTKETSDESARAPAGQPAAPATSTDDGLGPSDVLTAEVLERYPNGNLRIRGVKRVPFRRQVRNIEVLAIVKGTDIGEDDRVKSSRFFEQRVELYK
ncbi:MAG: flagellar basal body L-ring protein FlgH [Bdellovibrionota bacterium]